MAGPEKETTDGTSIKPVSSLRSHFENIASTSPVPNNSSRASPRFDGDRGHDRREQGSHERVSLDIPHRPSPWAITKETSHHESQQRSKAVGPPVTPRNERPRSALIHRPSSARPTSPHSRPPLVTIVSPKSPPRSVQLSHASSVPQLPSAKALPAGGLGSRPAPPVPPHSTRSTEKLPAQTPTPAALLGKKASVEPPMPMRKNNTASNINTTLANGPPLFNRAEKPKVPCKPSKSRESLALEPSAVVSDKRIWPFSTPPSSDESSIQVPQLQGSAQQIPIASSTDQRVSPFSPPVIQESLGTKTRSGSSSTLSNSMNTSSIPLKVNASQDAEEARPGLPPRRMTENGPEPRAIRSYEIASTTRSLRQVSSPIAGAVAPPSGFLPPPRRTGTNDNFNVQLPQRKSPSPLPNPTPISNDPPMPANQRSNIPVNALARVEYPDTTHTNRRPPGIMQGIQEIDINYDTRLFEICGDYLCTTGHLTRAWDLSTGNAIMSLAHGDQTKVTAIAFKPGATAEEEGLRLWLGTNSGDLYEMDIPTQSLVSTRSSAHNRREIVKIYRSQHSMWTLDEGGNLHVWSPDMSGLPNVQGSPTVCRVPKGHTFSLVVQCRLWLATGKDIRVFSPGSKSNNDFQLTLQPLSQQNVGEVTSGAVISSQHDRVYFGHSDGKVTVYSAVDFSCLGIVNVSVYKINALAGAGDYLWAGYNTGMIYVYDTRKVPWSIKKDWHAHSNPVVNILVNRSSVWKSGELQIASIGTDNAVRIWDGMLQEDWLENDMHDHDTDYCSFRELRALVITWNAGAATPTNLRFEEKDTNFFRDVLEIENPPDIVVYGFQELVDLEDKKLTAKSLFKGSKKKDTEHEHMSRQYRAWRDHLVLNIEDSMPSNKPYHLLHTASMVGLFSCVFVRSSIRSSISNLSTAEVKRGMGGLHGNKGCLILRFLIDDSSICLVNCHLAAGQTSTVHRNTDVSAIIESVVLPPERNPHTRCDSYSGGGDGSMILDHEVCILNGDLNYRIDTMPRDTVVKAVQAQNFTKLLERDQLLVSRRRNPGFRLRAFTECPITFAPTYKYDVGTDRYDTSEKHRAPAWCDRILYRGAGNIKQLEYRRHELRVSDHRPVSATFIMRIKCVSQEKRAAAWQACIKRCEAAKEAMARDEKVIYLRDVLGVNLEEAKSLV